MQVSKLEGSPEMHIVCMYLHTRLLAMTTGRASNASFDDKGCHSPGEVYPSFPRGLRGKEQSRNSECAGSRISGCVPGSLLYHGEWLRTSNYMNLVDCCLEAAKNCSMAAAGGS